MTRRIVFASLNQHKLAELQRMGSDCPMPYELVSVGEYPGYVAPREDGATFEENAVIKATACARFTGEISVADDSGIVVDALGGMPGIRSARWDGPDATDESNLQLLLRQMFDVEEAERTARFVCAVALAAPDGRVEVTRGVMEGVLRREPVGSNGFGYDPIFQPFGHTCTSAELSPEAKDEISHRGIAVREMMRKIALLDAAGQLSLGESELRAFGG